MAAVAESIPARARSTARSTSHFGRAGIENLKQPTEHPVARAGLSFYNVDLTIDAPTGLPSASRDVSGIETGLEYDALGRLTWEKPASGHGAWIEYEYTAASATAPAKVRVRRRANGSKTGTVLARAWTPTGWRVRRRSLPSWTRTPCGRPGPTPTTALVTEAGASLRVGRAGHLPDPPGHPGEVPKGLELGRPLSPHLDAAVPRVRGRTAKLQLLAVVDRDLHAPGLEDAVLSHRQELRPQVGGFLERNRLGLLGIAPGSALSELRHAFGLRGVGSRRIAKEPEGDVPPGGVAHGRVEVG